MNIAVVDDTKKDRDTLINYIKRFFNSRNMDCQLSGYLRGDDFVEESNLSLFDVVFLDIFIGEKNGVEIARYLRANHYKGLIVFCTVTAQFALAGYDVKAFGYILKPYTYDRIEELMQDILKSSHMESPSICIKENRRWYKIPLRDILYVENSANYVTVYTNDRIYSTRMAFRQMEEILGRQNCFARCNRGTIINLSHVSRIDGPCVIIKTEQGMDEYKLPVSRRYLPAINEQYIDYIFQELEK